MTLKDIKAAAAGYLNRKTEDLTVNTVDLGLIALNQVRLNAELVHDFGFNRKLVTVQVNGVTGGSLDSAVLRGTDTAVVVKSVIDVGLFNEIGDLLPAEWTVVAESLGRQREENPFNVPRYPTDGQAVAGPYGSRRFVFAGNNIYFYPKVENETFTLGLEVYQFTTDWVDADLTSSSTTGAPWSTIGSQYLLWGTVIHLNKAFKEFVFRQEGNLAEPQVLMDQGLNNLQTWDIFKYEKGRRHGR